MNGPVTRKCVSVAADTKVGLTQGLAHGGPSGKRTGVKSRYGWDSKSEVDNLNTFGRRVACHSPETIET